MMTPFVKLLSPLVVLTLRFVKFSARRVNHFAGFAPLTFMRIEQGGACFLSAKILLCYGGQPLKFPTITFHILAAADL
jgi:hypothetical protein